MTQHCLMLGAGHSDVGRKMTAPSSAPERETVWLTVDSNQKSSPSVVFNLNSLEHGEQLPFSEEFFDEIHAYEVLEHFGKQGDFIGFFCTFRELWRLLKKDGLLIGSSPSHRSEWAWGDPGHTRVITEAALNFLRKGHYDQLGKTPSSDYRELVEPYWWELAHCTQDDAKLIFALQKQV